MIYICISLGFIFLTIISFYVDEKNDIYQWWVLNPFEILCRLWKNIVLGIVIGIMFIICKISNRRRKNVQDNNKDNL